MTAIVQADPLYVPDVSAAPPRVRAAFKDVRARLLPGIAKAQYRAGAAGVRGCRLRGRKRRIRTRASIVELSEGAGADPVLRDVAVLATGFKTLSDKARCRAACPCGRRRAAGRSIAAAAPVPAHL